MKHTSGFLNLVEDAMTRVKEISADETMARMQRLEPLLLIDTREESEWNTGHIKGAQWLGKGIIERDIENRIPDKAAPIVLYCGGGYRSALAADNLQRMGYTNVLSMAGGWRTWCERGYPRT